MYCIVPLAGPDCYHPTYGIRPLMPINGKPLILEALSSRVWYKTGELRTENIIFVLREDPAVGELQEYLRLTFPKCKLVTLSEITKGALLSAAAGASLIEDFQMPIAVDLADLLYDAAFSPVEVFEKDPDITGIIPYFPSDNEKYSYLELEGDRVLRTKEKEVISNNASAGTYFFRNLSVFYQAISGATQNVKDCSYKGNLFLCPSYNALLPQQKVTALKVQILHELSLLFH